MLCDLLKRPAQQKGGPAGYGLLNGQMASTAGNAFWLRTAEVLRDNTTQRVKASKLAEPLYGLWAVNTAFEVRSNKPKHVRICRLPGGQLGVRVVFCRAF